MAAGFPPPALFQTPSNGIIQNPPAQVYSTIPKDAPHSYVQSWNVTVQRALPADFALQVGYVGNHGINVLAGIDLNAGLIPERAPRGNR